MTPCSHGLCGFLHKRHVGFPELERDCRVIYRDFGCAGVLARSFAADSLPFMPGPATAPPPKDLFEHRLLFVTGKGGVGKTTVAAALSFQRFDARI
jgi:hypothetical protein